MVANNISKQTIKKGMVGGAVMLVALPFTANQEGLRLKAYLDVGGIPTICYGETQNISIDQVVTKPECDKMLSVSLGYHAWQVEQAVTVHMQPKMEAALASFSYNVGFQNFKSSTLLKKLNSGDKVGACNQLPRWNRAKGQVMAGLTKRREAERQLCLEGIYGEN